MAEMSSMKCPTCAVVTAPTAVVNGMREYRCRACGLVFSGPYECDDDRGATASASAEDADQPGLPADWEMTTPGGEPPATGGAGG